MKLQIIAGFDACPHCRWPRQDGKCKVCDWENPYTIEKWNQKVDEAWAQIESGKKKNAREG